MLEIVQLEKLLNPFIFQPNKMFEMLLYTLQSCLPSTLFNAILDSALFCTF